MDHNVQVNHKIIINSKNKLITKEDTQKCLAQVNEVLNLTSSVIRK